MLIVTDEVEKYDVDVIDTVINYGDMVDYYGGIIIETTSGPALAVDDTPAWYP